MIYQAHKEEWLASMRAYRQAHKEELAAKKRLYYQTHKEELVGYSRAYRQAHKEEVAAKKRAYCSKTGCSVMHSRCMINRPVKVTLYSTARLYQDDLEYLMQHDIPIAEALRAALTDYVLDLKSKERGRPAWHEMIKAERDARIMSAGDDFRPEREVVPAAVVPAEIVPEIPREPAPDMTGWTREERGAWILSEGKIVPDRVIMVKRRAARSGSRARVT